MEMKLYLQVARIMQWGLRLVKDCYALEFAIAHHSHHRHHHCHHCHQA